MPHYGFPLSPGLPGDCAARITRGSPRGNGNRCGYGSAPLHTAAASVPCAAEAAWFTIGGETEMFTTIMIGSKTIDRSKKFYDALLGARGVEPATPNAQGRLVY